MFEFPAFEGFEPPPNLSHEAQWFRVFTVNDEVVAYPAGSIQPWVVYQAVQLLPVHIPQGVQREMGRYGAPPQCPVVRLAGQVSVPGEGGRGAADGAAGGGCSEGLALLQNDSVQVGYGNACVGGGQRLR